MKRRPTLLRISSARWSLHITWWSKSCFSLRIMSTRNSRHRVQWKKGKRHHQWGHLPSCPKWMEHRFKSKLALRKVLLQLLRTGKFCLLIQVGNPTKAYNHLYRKHPRILLGTIRSPSNWKPQSISQLNLLEYLISFRSHSVWGFLGPRTNLLILLPN
jgi:hypothetical protein